LVASRVIPIFQKAAVAGRDFIRSHKTLHAVRDAFAKERLYILLILAIGAAVRVIWHFRFPVFDTLDTAAYVASGDSLFATGRMASVMYMPLYPIILHVVGYDSVIWFQIALSTATIALVFALAF
jgi:hypothetical protein